MTSPAGAPAPVLPFTTGSPGMDSLVRSGIIALAGIITGAMVGWLNREGFTDPNLSLVVGTAIFGVLAAFAGAAWGFLQQKMTRSAVVDHVVAAAASGQVSAEIVKTANPAQLARIVATGTATTPEAERALSDKLNGSQLHRAN
jgi:hypothetical protein